MSVRGPTSKVTGADEMLAATCAAEWRPVEHPLGPLSGKESLGIEVICHERAREISAIAQSWSGGAPQQLEFRVVCLGLHHDEVICVREAPLFIVHHKKIFALSRPDEPPPWQRPSRQCGSWLPTISGQCEAFAGISTIVDHFRRKGLRRIQQAKTNGFFQMCLIDRGEERLEDLSSASCSYPKREERSEKVSPHSHGPNVSYGDIY